MAADLGVLTAVIYFWGGVESPAAVFYLVPVVWAASAVRGPGAYLVAAAATRPVRRGGRAAGGGPGRSTIPIMAGLSGHYYDRWPLVLLSVVLLGVAAHGAVYLTSAARRRTAGPGGTPDCDLLAAVVSSVTEGLIYLDRDGTVEMWNPAVASWFGGRLHEPGAAPVSEAEMPEGLRHFVERVRTSPTPAGPERFLVSAPGAPGEPPRRFRAYAAAVYDEESEHVGYAVVAVDVTEQLQFEEELRARNRERNREILVMAEALQRNQQEMSQHEKMVAIGTMAAGIAHEIGNPLASLSAVVQLLRRRPRSEQDARRLQTLEEQIERIARIVRQMLEFSRPAATDWVEADMDELTEQTVTMVSYSHRARSTEIQSIRNKNLPRVRTMPQLFQQVLVNLLLNALDAVSEKGDGGHIRVERAAGGRLPEGEGDRPGRGHDGGADTPRLRAVLYDQAPGPRHGPGPGRQLQAGGAAGRGDRHREHPGGGHGGDRLLQDRSAGRRGRRLRHARRAGIGRRTLCRHAYL